MTRHPHFAAPLFCLFCLALLLPLFADTHSYSITDFGATGEKSQLATTAIQAAIDSCAAAGGGEVYFPPGEYRSGTVLLRSRVTLHLESGATLFASRDSADFTYGLPGTAKPVLLYAGEAEGIGLRGRGVIDGQAEHSYDPLEEVDPFIAEITENAREAGVEMKRYNIVPPVTLLILFFDCRDIIIDGITIKNSPFWTLHLFNCSDAIVRGTTILSDLERGVNADGLDITGCRNVRVSDCLIVTGDDALAVKTKGKARRPSENITVTNCVLTSSSTALKIGTETYADIRHVVFDNCVVRDSNRGLSIVVRDGATISDIIFSNITIDTRRRHFNWWGNGDPIWIYLEKRKPTSSIGRIERITFDNIIAHARGSSEITTKVGPGYISDIALRNIRLYMLPEDYADKRADHAFEARDIENLQLENFQVTWDTLNSEPAWASALFLERIETLQLKNFRGRQGLLSSNHPAVILRNVTGATVSDLLADPGTGVLLSVENDSEDIYLQNIDPLNRAIKPLRLPDDAAVRRIIHEE